MKILLLLLIPFQLFAKELNYLNVDILEIENAPIALPVDFFPEEDPYEGVVEPTLQVYEDDLEELVQIYELSLEFKKKKLKGDPDFTELDKLIPPKKEPKKWAEEKKEPPIPRGSPENFQIYLKKGTRVKDLKFHSTKTIYRDIHVKAVREYPSAPFFKILDKSGTPRYEARAQDVNYLNETIDLDPSPKMYEVQVETPKNRSYDEKENFEHTIGLNGETWESSYFETITGERVQTDASAFKIDYKLYHIWDFPLNFGLSLSLENGSWESWNWNSMYFGLGLKAPWNLASWITLEGQINWQTSLFFSFKGPKDYSLTNNFVAFSAEIDFNTRFGTLFFQALYKMIYWAAKDQPIEVPAEKRDSSAVGLGVGVKFKSIFNL